MAMIVARFVMRDGAKKEAEEAEEKAKKEQQKKQIHDFERGDEHAERERVGFGKKYTSLDPLQASEKERSKESGDENVKDVEHTEKHIDAQKVKKKDIDFIKNDASKDKNYRDSKNSQYHSYKAHLFDKFAKFAKEQWEQYKYNYGQNVQNNLDSLAGQIDEGVDKILGLGGGGGGNNGNNGLGMPGGDSASSENEKANTQTYNDLVKGGMKMLNRIKQEDKPKTTTHESPKDSEGTTARKI